MRGLYHRFNGEAKAFFVSLVGYAACPTLGHVIFSKLVLKIAETKAALLA
jgi:hypothetical protein